jgi:molybdenum cofactor biosynthesis protein B
VSEAYHGHVQSAQHIRARCAVITLSDTRDESSDTSGSRLKDLLSKSGHTVSFYQVVPDEPATIDALLRDVLARDELDVIVTNGGTGISRRDHTIPVIEKLIACPLPGFGELFRMLSYEQIGSGAMLSRAVGGLTDSGKLLFALPGSTQAVELAITKLILPQIPHLIFELRK